MYIAGKEKEALRKYSGQSILVDATEVTQPVNPGDGLITKFKLLGPAKFKENLPGVQGLRLKAKQIFEPGNRARFELTIENQTDKVVSVAADAIAPTLLGEKDDDDFFSPSDGKSDAKITRTSLKHATGFRNENSETRKDSSGESVTVMRSFSVNLENENSLSEPLQIPARQERHFTVTFTVPSGDYDFLFGYGGGVHEGKGIASNIISFSVDEKGRAKLLSEESGTPSIKNSYESRFIKFLSYNFTAESFFLSNVMCGTNRRVYG